MHRIRLLVRSSPSPRCSLAAPARPASLVRRRRQPGLRRRRQQRRELHQRLRRALQRRRVGRRPERLDRSSTRPPAATCWQATPSPGQIPPGHYYLVQLSSAGVGRRRAARPRRDRDDQPGRLRRQGRARHRRRPRSPAAPPPGSCSAAATVEDFVGYGSASRLRGLGGGRRALELDRGRARRRRLHRHRLEPRRLHRVAAPTPRNSSAPAVDLLGGRRRRARARRRPPGVDVDIQPVLSLSLERPTISFGSAFSGDTPGADLRAGHGRQQQRGRLRARRCTAPCSRRPTCRSASRAPLPPAGRSAPSLAGGARAAIPIAPAADLAIGTTSARSAAGGDAWPTTVGFTGRCPPSLRATTPRPSPTR